VHKCSLTQLAGDYCLAHDIFATIPALEEALAATRAEEAELIAVGCPCDITAMYPLGGVEEGGFNFTLKISGLNTGRPKATGLACLFKGMVNDSVKVDAAIISTDTVQCIAPPKAMVMTDAVVNVTDNVKLAGIGDLQLASVDLAGATFIITRSLNSNKNLRYYKTPVFEFHRTTPGLFVTGQTSTVLRTVTVHGAHFNANAGGMLLRLSLVNGSIFQQVQMIVLNTTLATAIMPTSAEPGVFRLEISINSATWYNAGGDIEYVERPLIGSLTPNSGPVMGSTVVTITHTRWPIFNTGLFEAKVGQHYVPLQRISETETQMVTPAHTVEEDPSWYFPGNETVSIYIVIGVEIYTGIKTRFLYSRPSDSNEARLSYACSQDEIESKTCCPAGTAGPGGNNGAFCFTCEFGTFSPLVGTTSCLACPPHSVSHNRSNNCTCAAGFEHQIITRQAQECNACEPGTYRNDSMTSCMTCPVGTEPAPARNSCVAIFMGCPANAYQPKNDTEKCCKFGYVLPNTSITCVPCPAGTFFNTSSFACVMCNAGSYSAESGSLNCTR
jgi:hypothetical protein